MKRRSRFTKPDRCTRSSRIRCGGKMCYIGFHNSVCHSFSGSHFHAGTCFSSLQVDLAAEIWWTDAERDGARNRRIVDSH